MRRLLLWIGMLVLPLAPNWAVAGHSGIPGTKVTVTFEGICGRHCEQPLPGYDGLNWTSNILVEGKGGPQKNDPGLQAVIRGRAAAVADADASDASISAVTGTFLIKSGHFASFQVSNVPIVFAAYRNGIQVGTMTVTLQFTDTLIKFNKKFSNIDTLTIDGTVAMDNLKIAF